MKPLHIRQKSGKRLTKYWLEKRYDRIVGVTISIVLLITVYIFVEHYYQKRSEKIFQYIADEHFQSIHTRLDNYVQLLRSGIGFIYSSETIDREEWHRFVGVINPEKYYPGLQGIGFALMLQEGEEKSLRSRLNEEGFIPYTLNDAKKLQSVILYLEPLNERNLNAIGYDMYSEPTRRAAMDYAAATGEMSMSAKVTLVQEIDKNIQTGFLIYLPVFIRDHDLNGTKKLRGYVYSPIRAGDFFNSIRTSHEKLLFDIYDDKELLYSSRTQKGFEPRYHYSRTLEFGGRTWSVQYHSSFVLEQKYNTFYPLLIAIGVTVFNLTLLYIIMELIRKRIELKNKTKEIDETKVWLDRLLSFSADGIHILDTNGRLIGYSPSFKNMLGYDEAEMKYLEVFAWEVKLDRENIKEMMNALTEDGVTFESIFRRKDGSMIEVEVKAHTFYEDGIKYIFASSWDITERKESKQALQCEKELAQLYLDIVEVMILVIGIDFRIQQINRKSSEILGYSVDEAVGKNFIDLFIPERLREELRNVAGGLLSYDGNEYYENLIVSKNGEERLIAWKNRPIEDNNGIVWAILSSGEDITDLRRTQEYLIERESFYKTIFASVSEAIVILENYFIIDCNDQALEIFETSRENVIGQYIFHLMRDIECRNKSFVEHINSAYEGNSVATECSMRIHSYDIEPKIVELVLTSFGKSQDNKLIMILRDITQKIEEHRLLTMNARQAQMGEMISMIAHQWRQPLAIINAITSQIRMKAMLSEDEDTVLINNLIKIEQQSAHLSQTISDYRDFFRPDKPKERFYVVSLIDHAVNLIDHTLKNNSIRLEKKLGIDPVLFTYRNELLQVIMVLLKNALDAFTENKIIGGEIVFGVDIVSDTCIISVSDNAGGISQNIIKKIFIPYFTTKQKNNGTGLGLYMSKLIIEEHCNGKLDVASERINTVFTITLPYPKDIDYDT